MIIWKDVVGYEGYYEVSNTGLVRSVDRCVNSRWGSPKKLKGKLMKPYTNRYGYKMIVLTRLGKKRHQSIHQLVGKAFIENPESLETINHKDGNKLNNFVDNLEWSSFCDNHKHAISIGLIDSKGERNPKSKLTKTEVAEILYIHKTEGVLQKDLAKMFCVHVSTIQRILSGKSWNHISRGH